MHATLEIVRSALPSEYHVVRETGDELNYARTDRGDSVYVTLQFAAASTAKTKVRLRIQSLPS